MTLQQFARNVENLNKRELRKICEDILQEMTLRFLREVIRLTPVGKSKYVRRRLRNASGEYLRYTRGINKGRIKTKRTNVYTGGTLRRGWITKRRRIISNKAKPTEQEILNFVKTLKFKKIGKRYYIKVVNPVEYAKFVNYGHRTRGGRGWVEGYHFLEKAENYINRNQNRIFNKIFEERLRRSLGL